MGTLIPLSPALTGLANGDTAALSTDNAGRNAAKVAESLLGGGISLVVVGAGLWFYGHHLSAAEHITVAALPGYAQIGFSCAF